MENEDWFDQEDALEDAKSSAMGWAVSVAAGNVLLMVLLASRPFESNQVQLIIGLASMGLHGWAAWEILKTMQAWARASAGLAMLAAGVFKQAALAQRVKAGPQRKNN